MRLYRPRSFFTLLLTGFIFVSLPLLTALFSSVQILDGLVQQGSLAIYSAVDRTSSIGRIVDLLRDQERKARLYNVLGEREQLQSVNRNHKVLQEVIEHLKSASHDSSLLAILDALQAREEYVVAALNSGSGGPELLKRNLSQALEYYGDIALLTSELVTTGNAIMSKEVGALRDEVSRGKKTLAWQTTGLISFSILFVILFVVMISRPIRDIDRSIEHLGSGDFSRPIRIRGPKDLEALGERLEWLRKRLAELEREKVKMIAHISHELKTPLASIKEGVGLLRDELVGSLDSAQHDVVEILDSNSDKLQKLIENILNFNMSQARKMPVIKEDMRLDEIIRSVVTDHKASILAHGIDLNLDLAPVVVSGNEEQLKTVVDNLLANAMKFTPDHGKIKIRLFRKDKLAHCLVEDSGPGVLEEDRSQIFSPFYKGKQAQNAPVKGSGLGLAIAREYVQNHGGEIRLLKGKSGARFSITLPVAS